MKCQRLKNLVILVTAAAYFAATFLGQQMKLRILCEKLLFRPSGSTPWRTESGRFFRQATLRPPEAPPASLQLELMLGREDFKTLGQTLGNSCCLFPHTGSIIYPADVASASNWLGM
jgi:hypothetical protein